MMVMRSSKLRRNSSVRNRSLGTASASPVADRWQWVRRGNSITKSHFLSSVLGGYADWSLIVPAVVMEPSALYLRKETM